jgi:hypothetical protein
LSIGVTNRTDRKFIFWLFKHHLVYFAAKNRTILIFSERLAPNFCLRVLVNDFFAALALVFLADVADGCLAFSPDLGARGVGMAAKKKPGESPT